ncbi:MAG: NAD(+)/NADH kinase [Bryobacterales bacterium]|nr:NAD(+)/NADH kinase [Bryobacterales bacterium]MBV9401395.1 NAD(+)/NADH kinase [Bryobacterales bacterium]
MRTVSTAAILSKPRSGEAERVVPDLVTWLSQQGVAARLDTNTAAYAASDEAFAREHVVDGAQLVIVLGGDGTLLSAARAIAGRDIPIFAVNLGGLGFLTAIKTDELYPQLERALCGALHLEKRRLLTTELWRGQHKIACYEGLNDMVLAKAEIARMIDLEVHVDGAFVCVYKADGLIVATPTGSTAYSLSAGGPIVLPSVAAWAITPICPHTLTNRPVIVPDESVIEVGVLAADHATYLTIDGQVGELLKQGDRIVCRRSEHSISLVRPGNLLFFDVLREKLKWGGR